MLKIKFAYTEIMKHHKNDSLSHQKTIFEQELVLFGEDRDDSRVPATDRAEFPFEFVIPSQDPELYYRGSLISRIGNISVFSVFSLKALFTLSDSDKEFDYDEKIVNAKPRFKEKDPLFKEKIQYPKKFPFQNAIPPLQSNVTPSSMDICQMQRLITLFTFPTTLKVPLKESKAALNAQFTTLFPMEVVNGKENQK